MSDSANLWTVPHRDSSVQGILRQEYWSGLPFPPLGDYTDAGVETASPALAGRFFYH